MRVGWVGLVLIAFAAHPNAVEATTRRVPSDFGAIQEAIDASGTGDTITVAAGTYRGTGNRDITYRGKDLVLRSERGPELTIIDVQGGVGAMHRGFLFSGGQFGHEGPNAILDGFTIQNGFMATEDPPSKGTGRRDRLQHDLSGAGIMCRLEASPTIRNCIVRDCYSEFTGGGIGVEFGSAPRIENCVVKGCRAEIWGGALSLETIATATLVDCVFTGNRSERGGALHIGENATIIGCLISGNLAGTGGGLAAIYPARIVIQQTVIWNNCGVDSGAQVYIDPAISASGGVSFECSAVDVAGVHDRGGVAKYVGSTNVFSDPRFCAPESCNNAATTSGDYRLQSDSPCLVATSPCGLQIGPFAAHCDGTAVPARSWSAVKSLYGR